MAEMPVKRLAEMSWPEVDAGAPGWVLAVPLGATEQHGPHLPIGTDTLVAEAVAAGLASRRSHVVLAPALPFGASGEHAGFPGTLSLGQAGLETAVVELVRSADAFGGLVLVSGHGGNAEPLDRAAALSVAQGRAVLAWAPHRPVMEAVTGPLPADAHAGRVETSLLLHLAPHLVGPAAPGATTTAPVRELIPALRRSGLAGVSPSGVLGDPSGASASEGQELLGALVDDLVGAVDRWSLR